MKKTLKVGYGEKANRITIESTGKKMYGTMIWREVGTDNFYYVDRSRHFGKTIESASKYSLTKEEFEKIK